MAPIVDLNILIVDDYADETEQSPLLHNSVEDLDSSKCSSTDNEEHGFSCEEGIGQVMGVIPEHGIQGQLCIDSSDDIEEEGTRQVVGVILAPAVGMIFPTWDDVNEYYRSYGKQEGFGVVCVGGGKPLKKENGKWNSKGAYVWKCECYGRTTYRRRVNGKRVVGDEPIFKKKSNKCDFPVMIYAMNNDGGWEILNHIYVVP